MATPKDALAGVIAAHAIALPPTLQDFILSYLRGVANDALEAAATAALTADGDRQKIADTIRALKQ